MATNEATRFKKKPVEEKLKATNIYLRKDQLAWLEENTPNNSVFIRNAIDAAIRQWQLDNDDTDYATAPGRWRRMKQSNDATRTG